MTQVDILGVNGGAGEVADKLAGNGNLNIGNMRPYLDINPQTNRVCAYVTVYKGGDPKKRTSWDKVMVNNNPLQTNGTLRRDEWKSLDEAIMPIARERLGGIEDLISRGLTYNLGNAMGTTVLEWHDVSDGMEAVVTMDGITRGKNDRPKFQHNYLPIPIIHSDYEINSRALEASRKLGNPLDTISAEQAARRVAETLENMLFTDTTFQFGEKDSRNQNKIYSYVNFPDRNLVNLSIPWDNSAITPAGIIQDVMEMKQAMISARHYGKVMIYIPKEYEVLLDGDYSAEAKTTIRERILKINGIEDIKVSDTLAADNVLMVEMLSSTIRLVRGMGLTNVQWSQEGGMVTKYKIMTIQVPQIRSDQDGHCGIVHLA